jgi:hypothetical protein
MAFIGTPLDTRNTFQSLAGKRFDGDGSTTAFTLDVAPSSTLDIEVFVGNVRQDPNSAYTLSGTTLTFTGAPPSGTNNIYVVHQAKSVGTINAPDNSVDSAQLNTALLTGATDIGANIADADLFLIDDGAGGTLRKTAASRIKTYIGTSPITALNNATENELVSVGSTTTELDAEGGLTTDGSTLTIKPGSNVHQLKLEQDNATDYWSFHADSSGGPLSIQRFTSSAETEKVRITTTGSLSIGQTGDDGSALTGGGDLGCIIPGADSAKQPAFCYQNDGMKINRSEGNNNSLTLIDFIRNGSVPGSITASNSTVSYGTFLGVHYAQLTDDSKPTILVGTVMESINETCEWHQAKFTIPATEDTPERIRKEYVEKTNNVGDAITYNFEGTDYSATIIKENDEEYLARVKVSDTEDSKAVYGVFESWMESETNDISVGSLGAFMIRVHKDETVSIGDYLQSKGDGTAKVQADDILRASTIAKVVKTNKIKTYADGSYLVSCTLHCG